MCFKRTLKKIERNTACIKYIQRIDTLLAWLLNFLWLFLPMLLLVSGGGLTSGPLDELR